VTVNAKLVVNLNLDCNNCDLNGVVVIGSAVIDSNTVSGTIYVPRGNWPNIDANSDNSNVVECTYEQLAKCAGLI
jgi:formylmethanofuran dehydrogenase subunit D